MDHQDEVTRLFRHSQFQDLMRDLGRSVSDAPSNVRNVVSQILQHPFVGDAQRQFQQELRTPATSPTGQGTSSTVREEVRRAFTPTGGFRNRGHQARLRVRTGTNQRPATRKRKVKTVTKTVFLVNKGMTSMPVNKSELYKFDRVANCVKITSDMTEGDVDSLIDGLFAEKLRGIHLSPKYHFIKADRNKLYRPKVPEGSTWNGETVSSLAGTGSIYIMANGTIDDGFDSSLYCQTCESSDDEDLIETGLLNDARPRIPPTVPTSTLSVAPIEDMIDSDTLPDIQLSLRNRRRADTISSSSAGAVPDVDCLVRTAADDQLLEEPLPPRKRARLDEGNNAASICATDILKRHVNELIGHSDVRHITVSRLQPFRSFIRECDSGNLSDTAPFEVKFFDCMGTVDDGGPKREFLFRLLKEITGERTGLFQMTGDSGALMLTHNASKLETQQYYWAGRALVTVLVHGGPSTAVLTPALYQFLSVGFEEAEATVNDIPSTIVRDFIEKLKSAATDDALRLVVNAVDPITLEDGSSILLAAGINSNPRKSDVPAIVRRLTKFYALGMFRSEAEDFYKGLRHCAIVDLIMENPLAFKSIFVPGNNQPLKGSTVLSMFIPVFSEDGSNQRGKEDTLMELWATYLSDMDRGKTAAKPADVLRFASAVEEVPILGWGSTKSPGLVFDHDATHKYPGSSTCGPTVILRIWDYKDQDEFNKCFDEAVIGSPCILGN